MKEGVAKWLLLGAIAALLTVLVSCGDRDRPNLTLDDVERVTWTILVESTTHREATPTEVRRLVSAYAKAEDFFNHEVGTTPLVVAEIELSSGSVIRLGNGYCRFQTVADERGQWNVYGAELEQLLREVARDGGYEPIEGQ